MNNEKIIESYIKETSNRLNKKQHTLLIDSIPTEGSTNPVTSDGIKQYMDAKPSGGTEIEINQSQGTNELLGIQIDGDKYQIKPGTPVIVNETTDPSNPYIASITVNGDVYSFQKEISGADYSCVPVDMQIKRYGTTWNPKTWSGLTDFYGNFIWTDSENTYYSSYVNQYVLDKATSTWSQKIWSGLTNFNGEYIWTDGENIYFSSGSTQRVLDKTTSTWSTKSWTGLTNFNGEQIWTDGENIYYSEGSDQYVLDKTTSTWSQKTWTGLTNFSGEYIWTDGENIYFSEYSTPQYVLDKATSTWVSKTWSGLTDFDGEQIWTDGENIYFSAYSDQYVLDKVTSTWVLKTWNGLPNFYGAYTWTDGENIYYASYSTQYVLDKNSLLDTKEITTKIVPNNSSLLGTKVAKTITINGVVYRLGFNEYILLVQNLGRYSSTVVNWEAPSLDYFSNNTVTLSYLISVNDVFVVETQNTTYDLSGYLVSGENTVSITTKISITGQQGSTINVIK